MKYWMLAFILVVDRGRMLNLKLMKIARIKKREARPGDAGQLNQESEVGGSPKPTSSRPVWEQVVTVSQNKQQKQGRLSESWRRKGCKFRGFTPLENNAAAEPGLALWVGRTSSGSGSSGWEVWASAGIPQPFTPTRGSWKADAQPYASLYPVSGHMALPLLPLLLPAFYHLLLAMIITY